MSSETHVVLFNAVPLVALAAVYLGVAAAIVPNLWRQRGHTHVLDLAVGLTFPAIAVTAAILGAAVAREREPLVGHLWLSLAAVLITLAPALLFLARWGERALVLTGGARARAAVELVSLRDRELEAVTALSNELARARDAEAAARILLPKVQALLGVEFAALACIDERAEHAWGILALVEGEEADWWRDVAVDLRDEPSGIASAVFEVAPVTVFDVSTSRLVSPRLARAVGAKSGAWIPLVSEARVLGVLVLASTGANRAWTTEEISLAQAMAAEAALALDRFNSAAALADALDRERLVARISRRVRSELDVDALMRVATGEVGEALGATRCFIRVGETAEELRLGAEWHVENIAPVGELAVRLPVSNLAARDRRTTSIADVATAPELDDHTLGDRDDLIRFGTRSALAVPILVFDRMIGVVTVHRGEVHTWTQTEIELIEAVARELGLALHTARLLTENQRRLEQQAALLHAAQVVTSELELDVVLERLVEEMTRLFRADAADCYLYDERRRILRCAATYGLPASLVGFEFSPEHGLAGQAIAAGHAVSDDEYEALELRVPHEAYEGFARALSAPMTWGGHTRGVLGVGIRDGARRFDDADTELLEAYAGLAALALRNAESYEQRASQARVQRGFYRIASVLGEPISLDATVAAVAQAATEALGGQAAALVVPSPRGLSLAGSFQLPPELEAALRDGLPAGAEVLATAASERRVLTARAAQQDERFGGAWRELLASSDLSALLAVPIEEPRSDETALVIVLFAGRSSFTDDDLELARQLAVAARGALERGRLFEAERSARALAQQLARTGGELATELEPSAVLEEVVEEGASLLAADAASVRVLSGDELVVTASTEPVSEPDRTASTAWPAGDIVQSRAPLALADATAGGRPLEGEPFLAAGHVAYLGVPLFGPEGAPRGVLAVYSTRPRAWLPEEVEALAALAANASAALSNAELYQRVAVERERSVAILANIADGIVAVDREGKVVLWNAAAAQITGISEEEAIGRTPVQVLQRNLESDEPVPLPNRLVSIPKGGDEISLSLSEAVMTDPSGAVAGRIFAFRDISPERVVDQMKSDFVSAVSHDLRSPLTSIYGFAETLLRQDVEFGEAERRIFLGYIASESERLTRIVDTLLNVAQVDTGDLQVQLARIDVGSVLSEVVEAAKAISTNGHEFVVELDAAPLEAEADREKVRQILDQLIENAMKFSPSGGRVTLAARRRSDAVEVRVADEGIGIPDAQQARIFTKFFRADPEGPEGAGLGLFIAQGLVNAMGGRIWVDSAEGKGSSFTFELPLPRRGA